MKDEPAFADGKNSAARKAIIAFAMDNADLAKDPALIAAVLSVVRDPENIKDADMMELAVDKALKDARAAADAKKAEAPAGDAPAADAPAANAADPLAGALDAMAGALAGAADGEAPAELAQGIGEALAQGLVQAIGDSMAQAFSGDPNATATIASMGVNSAALAANNPFAQKADKLLDPARRIRRARREAEMRRDREPPVFNPIKGDEISDAQYNERFQFKATRENDRKRLDELREACKKDLAELKRNASLLQRESRPLLDAIRDREAQAEAERQKAAAAAKAQREAEARKAKVQGEVDEAEGVVRTADEAVESHDYDRALSTLAPYLGDSFSSEEAKAVIQNAHDKFKYLADLRAFFLKDLHENHGLRWGIDKRYDITDADPERGTVTKINGEVIEVAKLSLLTWVNLVDQLVDNRDPKRPRLGSSQHGDLLYGSAIFITIHGGGSENATNRAVELARKARTLRETVKRDIPRLTPELSAALEDQF